MKTKKEFIAVIVSFLFLAGLTIIPSTSYTQTEGAAGGVAATGEGAAAADVGAAIGISTGTIAAVTVGAAAIAAGIVPVSGDGGGSPSTATTTNH